MDAQHGKLLFFFIPLSNDDSCRIGITGIDYTSLMKKWLYSELLHSIFSSDLVNHDLS
jgi:hypothetical protein